MMGLMLAIGMLVDNAVVVTENIYRCRQRFPDQKAFTYKPFAEAGTSHKWDETAKTSMHDYNLLDLSI